MKKLLQTLRISMALLVASFSTNLLPLAYASAAPQPWTEETNQTTYWQNKGYGVCTKVDYAANDKQTSYTMPAVPANSAWTLLVLKAATTNEEYENPVAGQTYNSVFDDKGDDNPRNDGYKDISHRITCYKTTQTQVEANVTFDDQCGTANDTFTLEQKPGVTYTVNGSVNSVVGPQSATGAVSVTAAASSSAYTLAGTSSFSKTFTNVACPVVAVPVTANVTFNDECGTANDTFTLIQKTGVVYTVNGNVNTQDGPQTATGTVSVVASAASANYTIDGQTTFSKEFTTTPCPRAVEACESTTNYPVITAKEQFADYSYQDTRSKGHHEFVNDGLRIYTDDNSSEAKVAWYKSVNFALQYAGEPSMLVETNSGTIKPGLQMIIDFNNDGTTDGILVGESVYGNDWWLTNGSAQFVKDGAPSHSGGFGSTNHGTLDQWLTNFPNAQVKAVGFSLGSGVLGDYTIRSLTFGCVVYTFDYVQVVQPCTVSNKSYVDTWMYDGDTYPATNDEGNYAFTTNGLELNTAGIDDFVYGFIDGGNTKLSAIDNMSYETYRKAVSGGFDGTLPAYILLVDTDGSAVAGGYKYFFYEPYYNGTVSEDTWQTWDAINGGNAKWYVSGTGQTLRTWSYLVANYPNAEVAAYGFNQGTYNAETFTVLQDLEFDCATTRFSAPQVLGDDDTKTPVVPVTPVVTGTSTTAAVLPAELPATGAESNQYGLLLAIVLGAASYLVVLRRQEA